MFDLFFSYLNIKKDDFKMKKAVWSWIKSKLSGLRTEERAILVIFTILPVLLSFSPNNKIFILSFLLGFLVLSYMLSDLRRALLYLFMYSLPFGLVGKAYDVYLVYPPIMKNGIMVSLVFSIQEILALIMIMVLVRDFVVNLYKNIKAESIPSPLMRFGLLLVFAALGKVIASVFGSLRSDLSLLLLVKDAILPVIFFFMIIDVWRWSKIRYREILLVIVASIVFISLVSVGQLINRSPLGLAVELDTSRILASVGSDDDATAYRSVSVFAHPNDLAAYLLPYAVLFSSVSLFALTEKNLFGPIALILWLALFSAGTRAAIVIGILCLLLSWVILSKRKYMFRLPKLTSVQKTFLVILFGLIFLNFIPRLINIGDIFTGYGGMTSRLALIQVALDIFTVYPLFGVGYGMAPFYTFRYYQASSYAVSQVVSYFPAAVHNSYLYILEESGLFGLLPYLILLWYLFRSVYQAINHNDDKQRVVWVVGIFCGLLASIVNSMFHIQSISLSQIVVFYLISGIVIYDKTSKSIYENHT